MLSKLMRFVLSARPVAVAALVAMSTHSAQAFDGALGSLTPNLSSTFQVGADFPSPIFFDVLTFSLDSDVSASFTAKGQGLSIPGLLTLTGSPALAFAIFKGETALTDFGTSFSGLTLSAGTDYAFAVTGYQGGYSVTWSLTPIPEPQTMALLLGGLAVAGSLVRRRSRAH